MQTIRMLARPTEFLDDCRARHGETFTVRIARAGELVMISDPASIKRLFGADRSNTLPPGRALLLEPVLGRRSTLLLEGSEHMRRRRLMLPPFHGERMRAYEELIADTARREIARWPRGEAFALHPRMQAITLEVILRAVYGVSDDERLRELTRLIKRMVALTQSPAAQIVGIATRPLGRLGPVRRLLSLLGRIDVLLAAQIAEARDDPALDERTDILAMLVAARFEDGSAMGDGEIRDQLMTLLLAGHETTATSLAWAFDLALRRAEVVERMRADVGAGGHDYLDAVATEALRLRPVIPQVGRTIAEPGSFGDHELPAGTNVMPSIWLTHTREDLYPEPREFRPERFLAEGPETYAWIPFGGGTRRCLGAAFAQFEMRIVLREVIARAELRPVERDGASIMRRNVTLAPRGGVPVVAR